MNNVFYNMLIISGPSGAGKSTLTQVLQENIANFYFSISTTTRSPREHELHGREYFFTTKEAFKEGIKNGEFLEHEEVHDNFYGTSIKPITQAIQEKKFILFDVDVRGHNSIKKHYPLAKSVFIVPKNLQVLEERLCSRGTDSKETIQKRLSNAKEELKYANAFDYLLINDNMTSSKQAILHIAKSLMFVNHETKMRTLLAQYAL
ncbi:guanylate kinase [Helicobacter trogontum]|uniref:Guanylate kinase n=1 Tax=Helicobacter trogontum TaxID=50960 RepID=A0A099VBE5_9HELI|nr:guanylate kinase [Helicobacter trogontum]TLD84698.1 guanylate kinase [Helicobacter trogontum]